jgi:hypothetical protein
MTDRGADRPITAALEVRALESPGLAFVVAAAEVLKEAVVLAEINDIEGYFDAIAAAVAVLKRQGTP